jgi:hypothetical protein
MNVVSMKKSVNLDLIASLKVILAEAEAGDAQAMAVVIQYSNTEAVHAYVPSTDPNLDERLMLAELTICQVDTAMSMAKQDAGTFASRIFTTDDVECE